MVLHSMQNYNKRGGCNDCVQVEKIAGTLKIEDLNAMQELMVKGDLIRAAVKLHKHIVTI